MCNQPLSSRHWDSCWDSHLDISVLGGARRRSRSRASKRHARGERAWSQRTHTFFHDLLVHSADKGRPGGWRAAPLLAPARVSCDCEPPWYEHSASDVPAMWLYYITQHGWDSYHCRPCLQWLSDRRWQAVCRSTFAGMFCHTRYVLTLGLHHCQVLVQTQ